MILTPLQKLPNNEGDLGKIIVATGFECLPKKQKKSPNLVTLTLVHVLSAVYVRAILFWILLAKIKSSTL